MDIAGGSCYLDYLLTIHQLKTVFPTYEQAVSKGLANVKDRICSDTDNAGKSSCPVIVCFGIIACTTVFVHCACTSMNYIVHQADDHAQCYDDMQPSVRKG